MQDGVRGYVTGLLSGINGQLAAAGAPLIPYPPNAAPSGPAPTADVNTTSWAELTRAINGRLAAANIPGRIPDLPRLLTTVTAAMASGATAGSGFVAVGRDALRLSTIINEELAAAGVAQIRGLQQLLPEVAAAIPSGLQAAAQEQKYEANLAATINRELVAAGAREVSNMMQLLTEANAAVMPTAERQLIQLADAGLRAQQVGQNITSGVDASFLAAQAGIIQQLNRTAADAQQLAQNLTDAALLGIRVQLSQLASIQASVQQVDQNITAAVAAAVQQGLSQPDRFLAIAQQLAQEISTAVTASLQTSGLPFAAGAQSSGAQGSESAPGGSAVLPGIPDGFRFPSKAGLKQALASTLPMGILQGSNVQGVLARLAASINGRLAAADMPPIPDLQALLANALAVIGPDLQAQLSQFDRIPAVTQQLGQSIASGVVESMFAAQQQLGQQVDLQSFPQLIANGSAAALIGRIPAVAQQAAQNITAVVDQSMGLAAQQLRQFYRISAIGQQLGQNITTAVFKSLTTAQAQLGQPVDPQTLQQRFSNGTAGASLYQTGRIPFIAQELAYNITAAVDQSLLSSQQQFSQYDRIPGDLQQLVQNVTAALAPGVQAQISRLSSIPLNMQQLNQNITAAVAVFLQQGLGRPNRWPALAQELAQNITAAVSAAMEAAGLPFLPGNIQGMPSLQQVLTLAGLPSGVLSATDVQNLMTQMARVLNEQLATSGIPQIPGLEQLIANGTASLPPQLVQLGRIEQQLAQNITEAVTAALPPAVLPVLPPGFLGSATQPQQQGFGQAAQVQAADGAAKATEAKAVDQVAQQAETQASSAATQAAQAQSGPLSFGGNLSYFAFRNIDTVLSRGFIFQNSNGEEVLKQISVDIT